MQSTAARPGTMNTGRMYFVSSAPTNSSRPKSSSSGNRKLAIAKIITSPAISSSATPPCSGAAAAESRPFPLTPRYVAQTNTQPSTRTATQIGEQRKHSFRMALFMIKAGLRRARTAITAEIVRIATQSSGRKAPMMPLIASARILTRMVQRS